MSLPASTSIPEKIQRIESDLNNYFVERTEEIRGLSLTILSDTNILLLGDPGVGKSLLVDSWNKHIEGSTYFSYLVTPFTTPEEVLGQFSLKALQDDRFVRVVDNTMATAHSAFIDEFWNANSALLNSFLKLMNERTYTNEGKEIKSNLLLIAGASNQLPEAHDNLDAALDRFVFKFVVRDIAEAASLKKMIDNYLTGSYKITQTVTLDEINQARQEVKQVKVTPEIVKVILTIKARLFEGPEKIKVSPRVLNLSIRAMQASAYLDGRDYINEDDLMVLSHTFWHNPDHEKAITAAILKHVNPDNERVISLYSEAKKLYDRFNLVENAKQTPSDPVSAQILEEFNPSEIVTIVQSLGNLKNELSKLSVSIKEKGRDSKTADQKQLEVTQMMQAVMSRGFNFDMDSTGIQ
jgi:MoxR-like ATPase